MNQLYYSFVSVVSPVETPFHNLHEVFKCFSTPAVTPHPMEAETNPGPSLVESFKLAFDDSETADVKFLVEGREINAHRALLKIRCQHFRSMFQVCTFYYHQKICMHEMISQISILTCNVRCFEVILDPLTYPKIRRQ